jgi:hypothetical protein
LGKRHCRFSPVHIRSARHSFLSRRHPLLPLPPLRLLLLFLLVLLLLLAL